MLNRGIVPRVPIHGSVDSSGDLCPLAHLSVVLVGEGSWFVVRAPGDLAHGLREIRRGMEQLEKDLGMTPAEPSYKEALALINGTAFSAALLALAVHDAESTARIADTACALSFEAVCGCARAFDARVHEARGHAGQIASAANIRTLLSGGRLIERARPVVVASDGHKLVGAGKAGATARSRPAWRSRGGAEADGERRGPSARARRPHRSRERPG